MQRLFSSSSLLLSARNTRLVFATTVTTAALYYAATQPTNIAYALSFRKQPAEQQSTSSHAVAADQPRTIQHLDLQQYEQSFASIHTTGEPNYPPVPADYELLAVQLVHRHGARTPVVDALNDRELFQQNWGTCNTEDHKPMKCGRGQLTPIGEQQLLDLGQQMRKVYVNQLHFLPAEYHPSASPPLLYSRSTDVFRTRISAARFLEGLYPHLKPTEVVQMMDVRPAEEEYLYPSHKRCPRLRQIYAHASQEFMKSYESVQSPEAKQLKHRIEKLYGRKLDSIPTWIAAADEWKSRMVAGVDIPLNPPDAEHANNHAAEMMSYVVRGGVQYPADVSDDTRDSFEGPEQKPEVTAAIQLGMGLLVNDLQNNFQQVLQHPQSQDATRLYHYSGHDTTILPLAETIGAGNLFAKHWVPFGSFIALELLKRRSTSDYPTASASTEPAVSTQSTTSASHQQRQELDDAAAQKLLSELHAKQLAQSNNVTHDAVELAQESSQSQETSTPSADQPLKSSRASSAFAPANAPERSPSTPASSLTDAQVDDYFVRIIVNYNAYNKVVPYKTFAKQMSRYAITRDGWVTKCKALPGADLPDKFQW